PFAVLRADTGVIDLYHDVGDWDVRIGLLRDSNERYNACDDGDDEGSNHQSGVFNRPIDDLGHARAPAGTAFTCDPSATNSWPTVMTLVPVGRPVTHIPSGPSETILTGW